MGVVIRIGLIATLGVLGLMLARQRMRLELRGRDDRRDKRWLLVVILAYAPIPLVLYAWGRLLWAIPW
jgi:hypothetical protein